MPGVHRQSANLYSSLGDGMPLADYNVQGVSGTRQVAWEPFRPP